MTDDETQTLELQDPDMAAVFIADESGHPYDVDAILTDRSMYRRCLREAKRLIPQTPGLLQRLADAEASLDWVHQR